VEVQVRAVRQELLVHQVVQALAEVQVLQEPQE
jgi:hypothetical protein